MRLALIERGRLGWLRRAAEAAVIALPLVLGLATAPTAAMPDYPILFGTHEFYSQDLSPFPKWRSAVERYYAELKSCAASLCDREGWRAFIERLRALGPSDRIAEVNRELNRMPYIVDSIGWGVNDYWATPFEFLRKSGDCEDYAIAKYMALRALDVPTQAMRIVVLQDLNLRLAHAILVVYVDGEALVLDNQIRNVVPADSIHHYQPIYSVNEDGWWLHRP